MSEASNASKLSDAVFAPAIGGGKMYFDVWRSNHGAITAKKSDKQFVSDGDAPYGYATHEIRVLADNGADALKQYRQERDRDTH